MHQLGVLLFPPDELLIRLFDSFPFVSRTCGFYACGLNTEQKYYLWKYGHMKKKVGKKGGLKCRAIGLVFQIDSSCAAHFINRIQPTTVCFTLKKGLSSKRQHSNLFTRRSNNLIKPDICTNMYNFPDAVCYCHIF